METEKEEGNTALQLSDTESSLKDRRITDAGWPGQLMNMEEDHHLFLKEFPAQKAEIEKCIRCLRETAGAISKTHKCCTIAKITASSAGVTSGILTILGLSLAPVTAGASMIFTATGLGLGAAAAATGYSANISEHLINSQHSRRSQALIKTGEESLNKCKESLATLLGLDETDLDFPSRSESKQPVGKQRQVVLLKRQFTPQIPKVLRAVKEIQAYVRSLKVAPANSALKVLAKQVGSATQASLKGVKQVEKAFKGMALALSKGARVMGAVSAGMFILYDTIGIAQDVIRLAKGAEAEKATEIREAADNLEKVLQNLIEQYEELKRDVGMLSWE